MKALIEVVRFDVADVITASGDPVVCPENEQLPCLDD